MYRRYGSRPNTAYVRSCKRKTSIPYRVPLALAERLGWEAGRCIPIPPASIRQRGAISGMVAFVVQNSGGFARRPPLTVNNL